MKCLNCGKELTSKWQVKYCSRDCMWQYQRKVRAKAKAKRWTRICEQCGKEFVMHAASGKANRGEVKEGRFCSRKCRGEWSSSVSGTRVGKYKVGETKPIFIKACIVCGALFTARWENRLPLCSKECRNIDGKNKYYENRTAILKQLRDDYEPKPKSRKICKVCGGSFESNRHSAAYCSVECRNQANSIVKHIRNRLRRKRLLDNTTVIELITMEYLAQRDGNKCGICNKKVNIKLKHPHPMSPTIDHIVPVSLGGEHTKKNTRLAHMICNARRQDKYENDQLRLCG
ncbi:MAG: HNH endonuclease [Syntrophorhabdus sp. PtaU1.Bin153]|nr:MAG: HNH endonuclease [Syntrophorhabdus sp. PtaU1.Bin153]